MPKIKRTLLGDDRTAPTPAELKKWRKECGKTQREAGDWLRVPLRTYQKWEQGERVPHNPGLLKVRMAALRATKPRQRQVST